MSKTAMKVETEAPAAETVKKAVTKKRKASSTKESGKRKKPKTTKKKKPTTKKKKKSVAKKKTTSKKKAPPKKKKQPSTLLKLKLEKELLKVQEKQKAMGLSAEESDYPGLLRMQQAFIRRYRRLEAKIDEEDKSSEEDDETEQDKESEEGGEDPEGDVKAIKYANRLLRIEMRWVVERIKNTETFMTELIEGGKAFVVKRTPKGSEKVVETFKYLDSAKNRELGRVGKEYTREFYETVEEQRVQVVMKPASGSKPAKVPFKKFKKNKKVSTKKLDADGNPIKGEPGPWIKALNEAKEDLKKQGHDVPRFMKCRSTLQKGATEMNKLEHTLWILAKEIMTRNKQAAADAASKN